MKSTLLEFLSEEIGLDAESIGVPSLDGIIRRHLSDAGFSDEESYFRHLKDNPSSLEKLITEVVVPETWFFRDTEPFVFIEKQIREKWCSSRKSPVLRVLSAPCSFGDESYSLAIMLFELGFTSKSCLIDAVDISEEALIKAREARFGNPSFREKNWEPSERFFTQIAKEFEVVSRVRELVKFSRGNIIKPDFILDRQPYDVIFCRNLLIYLTSSARRALVRNLDNLIKPEGILVVGHSEVSFFLDNGYSAVPHKRSFSLYKNPGKEGKSVVFFTAPKEFGEKKRLGDSPLPVHYNVSPLDFAAPAADRSDSGPHPKDETPGESLPSPTESKNSVSEPDFPTLMNGIRTLADRGYLREAGNRCETLLKVHQSNSDAFSLYGVIDFASDRLESAETSFLKALYLDPENYEALIHLSLLYEKKGNLSQARIFRDRVKKLELKLKILNWSGK